ncbi:MAG: carboxypeptidase-like regulatory domain-containing protein [Polyangiales bacterium]
MLLLAGIAGVCGWVARGIVPLPEATAEPRPQCVIAAPPVIQVVMAAPGEVDEDAVDEAVDDEGAEDDAPEDAIESGGEDMGQVIARAQLHVADHNSIYGKVTDEQSGDPLVGVTVVVTGPQLAGSQTAITDETGFYKLSNLPTGYVLATFYYGDRTVERDNLLVSSLDPTPVDERIGLMPLPPPPPPPPPEEWVINIPEVRVFEGIVIDEDYTYNIPVSPRTFESALGAGVGDADTLGVSFSSGTTIENTYVIE